jgi:5-methylcytosine-specific restriction enzyme subunit McrC
VALLSGLTELQSLAQFYEHVAFILAKGVLRRGHKGFHHDYVSQSGKVSYIRGKVLLHNAWNRAHHHRAYCQYETHTADIPDNQILAYTLGQLARTRRCRPQIQTAVRRATHLLQNITTPVPFSSQDCHGRHYTRLNQDYKPLHALCRFLLEHQSPGVQQGAYGMMPFLMNMARLYELFVAEWLQSHLPSPWHIKAQETVTVGADNELRFDIDLVLYDGQGEVHAVLDTKYKVPHKINHADINQIVTYAKAKRCHQAILIYPAPLTKPLDVRLEDLRIRSLAFVLDGDLEASGEAFLAALLPL